MPTRRQLLASASALATGGIAMAIFSQSTQAQTSVDLNGLDIPDSSKTADELTDVILTVDASYSYDTDVSPSKVVLRLEANHANGFRQIDAVEVSNPSQDQTGTLSLDGSLTTLDGLTTGSMIPETRGETNTFDVEIRVTMNVRYDGRKIATADASDTTTISATKKDIQISSSIGGDGSIEFTTPTE